MDDLKNLRTQIDGIDDEIFDLLVKRFSLCEKIGELKNGSRKPVEDSSREKEICERIESAVPQEIAPYIVKIYETTFEQSKKYQSSLSNGEKTGNNK